MNNRNNSHVININKINIKYAKYQRLPFSRKMRKIALKKSKLLQKRVYCLFDN